MKRPGDHGRHRRSRAASAAAAALVAIVGVSAHPLPAIADPDAPTSALCSDASIGCAIEFDPVSREGVAYQATVRGAPQTSISVQAYLVHLDGDRIESLEPFSDTQQGVLSAQGIARVGVGLGSLPDDQTGGFLLVSLAGAQGTDVSQMVGSFSVFGAASPALLGDGYGEQKPVGQVLDMQYFASMAYARFAVDYQDDLGEWHEVTAPAQSGDTAESPDAIGHIRYMVPRGLQQKAYQFRLRNLAVGKVVSTWTVIPSLSPPTQDRLTVWAPPEVGSAIGNATVVHSRNSTAVKIGAAAVAATAVGIVAGSSISTTRRRHKLRLTRQATAA